MLEKFFEFIAPDECVVCGREGRCICVDCSKTHLRTKKPACVLCNALNDDNKVCSGCRAKTHLVSASIAYRYDGVVKELVRAMKYQNRRSIARYFGRTLPAISDTEGAIVSFVPCDGGGRRRRGYDQAELLAKVYAQHHGYVFKELLVRSKHKQQVGQGRRARFENIYDNFLVRHSIDPDKRVILVDDVVTTGATISECARVLHNHGVKKIWAVAIAKK